MMMQHSAQDQRIRTMAADLVERLSGTDDAEIPAIIGAAAMLIAAGVIENTTPGFARERAIRRLLKEFEDDVRVLVQISTAPDAA